MKDYKLTIINRSGYLTLWVSEYKGTLEELRESISADTIEMYSCRRCAPWLLDKGLIAICDGDGKLKGRDPTMPIYDVMEARFAIRKRHPNHKKPIYPVDVFVGDLTFICEDDSIEIGGDTGLTPWQIVGLIEDLKDFYEQFPAFSIKEIHCPYKWYRSD